MPGGRDRPVTAGNRVEYIHRVANHRLNVQIRGAAEAFRGGLELVVAREWTAMFNEGELQMLVAGGEGEGLDIGDLRAHVNYAGGYHEEHPVIHDLWEVRPVLWPMRWLAVHVCELCRRLPAGLLAVPSPD